MPHHTVGWTNKVCAFQVKILEHKGSVHTVLRNCIFSQESNNLIISLNLVIIVSIIFVIELRVILHYDIITESGSEAVYKLHNATRGGKL